MVYTPVLDIILIFVWSQNFFWLSKILTNLSYIQSFRHIALKLWKIEAIQNQYPIVLYDGMSDDSESKNPRPLSVILYSTRFFETVLKYHVKYHATLSKWLRNNNIFTFQYLKKKNIKYLYKRISCDNVLYKKA